MSNKSIIHAALTKLASAAINFAPAADGPALLVLHNAVADAVRSMPDALAMANLRDVGAPLIKSDGMTYREIAAERDRLLAECKEARTNIAKLTEQIAMFRAFESAVKFAIDVLAATDTPTLILVELRKHTELLTALCQHQDDAMARQDRGVDIFSPRRIESPAVSLDVELPQKVLSMMTEINACQKEMQRFFEATLKDFEFRRSAALHS
ncbi:hypothetical protein ACQ4WP_26870 [Janthinobacterium sp. GB4P2]|uniref:hypothetical protein n=1 Tax=Janthinobacterium sp. GB4P2 TaxID=3424189 RepID=UPI003F242AC6